jgi:CBS domain-containing protein
LIGIVTRSDLFRAIEVAAAQPAGSRLNLCVNDIMVKDPICVGLTEETATVLMTMREHGVKTIPVLEDCDSRIVKGYVRIENIMHEVVKRVLDQSGALRRREPMKTTNILKKVTIDSP